VKFTLRVESSNGSDEYQDHEDNLNPFVNRSRAAVDMEDDGQEIAARLKPQAPPPAQIWIVVGVAFCACLALIILAAGVVVQNRMRQRHSE